jgi:hypothetical protein
MAEEQSRAQQLMGDLAPKLAELTSWWYPSSTPITLPSGSGHQTLSISLPAGPVRSVPAYPHHFIPGGGRRP